MRPTHSRRSAVMIGIGATVLLAVLSACGTDGQTANGTGSSATSPVATGSPTESSAARSSAAGSSAGAASSGGFAPTIGSRLDVVRRTKALRVCTTGDYRPFSYLDPKSNSYTGIDISMATALAGRLGAEPHFVKTSWKSLIPEFTVKCDMAVGGISVTDERAQQALYTRTVLTEGKTPITLCANKNKYATIDQINTKGVRVITPIGGTNERFADANLPDATIIRSSDNNTIFDQIVAGKADVMVTDSPEAKWVAHRMPKLCAVHPDQPFNTTTMAYLLPKGDTTFKKYVDGWLAAALRDGTYAAAEKPWYG